MKAEETYNPAPIGSGLNRYQARTVLFFPECSQSGYEKPLAIKRVFLSAEPCVGNYSYLDSLDQCTHRISFDTLKFLEVSIIGYLW